MNTTVWNVSGMTCGGCAKTIQKVLGTRLPEGTQVTADHKAGLVTIVSAADVAETEIKDAVERAGYNFGGRA